jgi:hypothetical protein
MMGGSAMVMQSRPADVRCARCNRVWSVHAWRELPKRRTLTGADVSAYARPWPANAAVEVRACSGCGADIARRVPATSHDGFPGP